MNAQKPINVFQKAEVKSYMPLFSKKLSYCGEKQKHG